MLSRSCSSGNEAIPLARVAVVLVNSLSAGLTKDLTAPYELAVAAGSMHRSRHVELLVAAQLLAKRGIHINGAPLHLHPVFANLQKIRRNTFSAIGVRCGGSTEVLRFLCVDQNVGCRLDIFVTDRF